MPSQSTTAVSSQRLLNEEVFPPPTAIPLGGSSTTASTAQQHSSHHHLHHRHSRNDLLENDEPFFWRFADFNEVGERSRDGSVHATDEVFNSISHLAALIISILGSVLLISKSCTSGALVPWKIVAFSIYGLSLCNLFACSAMHHAITTTKYYEQLFQLLDYLAIFPLIAGTFTPLCLVYMHQSVIGWTFLSVVWTISILSMVGLSHHFEKCPKWLTTTLYITLGWFGAALSLFLYPTYLPLGGIVILVLGGIFYTVGGYIFTTEKPSSHYVVPGKIGFHEIWHILVICGAATHWALMYMYVLPYNPIDSNNHR
ncbi:hemolysin III [Nitzschia inconspicua]|uniref:Hemolysin III n=1 Tax=Nitzschia inconspicua TaxID=303405 RepID=A0A9K3LWP7_9STRA|nr:hemolysin III [Nitzschia inconspicua]